MFVYMYGLCSFLPNYIQPQLRVCSAMYVRIDKKEMWYNSLTMILPGYVWQWYPIHCAINKFPALLCTSCSWSDEAAVYSHFYYTKMSDKNHIYIYISWLQSVCGSDYCYQRLNLYGLTWYYIFSKKGLASLKN